MAQPGWIYIDHGYFIGFSFSSEQVSTWQQASAGAESQRRTLGGRGCWRSLEQAWPDYPIVSIGTCPGPGSRMRLAQAT